MPAGARRPSLSATARMRARDLSRLHGRQKRTAPCSSAAASTPRRPLSAMARTRCSEGTLPDLRPASGRHEMARRAMEWRGVGWGDTACVAWHDMPGRGVVRAGLRRGARLRSAAVPQKAGDGKGPCHPAGLLQPFGTWPFWGYGLLPVDAALIGPLPP